MIEFTLLPLENQINILWFCDESTLINMAQINKAYYHLILGTDDDDDSDQLQANDENNNNNNSIGASSTSEISAYRNTIWKFRLLGELNRLIDEYNKTIIDHSIDTSLLNNLNENDLILYLKNNLKVARRNKSSNNQGIRYSALLSSFKKLKLLWTIKHASISEQQYVNSGGRILKNKGVQTWISFMNTNYPIISMSDEEDSNSSVDSRDSAYCMFQGFEMVIDVYAHSGNDWNIVYGVGGSYHEFGSSLSIAEFTVENAGAGYIVQNNQFKVRGENIQSGASHITLEPVKKGDRFSVKVDQISKKLHFFKNGVHIVSLEGVGGDILKPMTMYYPIISMCVDMGITFYPLLQIEYPLNENVHTVRFAV